MAIDLISQIDVLYPSWRHLLEVVPSCSQMLKLLQHENQAHMVQIVELESAGQTAEQSPNVR